MNKAAIRVAVEKFIDAKVEHTKPVTELEAAFVEVLKSYSSIDQARLAQLMARERYLTVLPDALKHHITKLGIASTSNFITQEEVLTVISGVEGR